MIRWQAEITYLTDAGPRLDVHLLEEVHDLHQIVERGPHWDAIDHITIRRHGRLVPLTVEAAEQI